jgi:hypothetical protein
MDTFGMSESTLSRIINSMLLELNVRYASFVDIWPGLTIDKLHTYTERISTYTDAVITDVWGFIDGTLRYMCRPCELQEAAYSGHKHTHGQKYQAITAPDGLIVSLKGPYAAAAPDITMYNVSDVAGALAAVTSHDDHRHYLLGDKAYQCCEQVVVSFMVPRNEHETAYNQLHSSTRIAVEWGFGKVVRYFAYINYKYSMKVHLQPIALYYRIAVLFTNIHTCMNQSSQAATLFNCNIPTLQQYLNP